MRYLPLLLLFGCAALKPLPAQSLTCLHDDFTSVAFSQAALCIATLPAIPAAELCFEAAGVKDAISLGMCEATAIAVDVGHAHQVADAAGVPTVTVQARAALYLQARGVTVQVATSAPTAPSP